MHVGCKVKLLDIEYEDEDTYHLVGSTEADPSKFRISDESPVGIAIMNRKIDDIVDIITPSGIVKMKILCISK